MNYLLKFKFKEKPKSGPTKIEDVIMPQDKLHLLQEELKKYGPQAYRTRFRTMRRFGYVCCTCDNLAAKTVYFRRYGSKVVERYCDACFGKEGFE